MRNKARLTPEALQPDLVAALKNIVAAINHIEVNATQKA